MSSPTTETSGGPRRDAVVGRLVGGRYRVLARVARGGMATVYRAEDTRLGREVALKVMHPHLAESEEFVARFRAEARAAASVQHRFVVAVHDQGADDDLVWLAMDLLPGRTLRDVLRERGSLSPAEAYPVMEALLQGLAAAHASGLTHRDVKPENVLVTRDGGWCVSDFGLARAATASRTATGSLLGTPEYIAPEAAQSGQVDARTDVYSAGIVLFELLTGRQPHTGEVPFQVVWSHVTTDVPPASSLVPHLPPEVDDLVAWACRRDPDERPQSADRLLARMRRVWSHLEPDVLDARAPALAAAAVGAGERARPASDRDGVASGASARVPPPQRWWEDVDEHDADEYDDRHDSDPDARHTDRVARHDPRPWAAGPRGDDAGPDDDGTRPTTRLPVRRRRRPGLAGVLLVLLLASVLAAGWLWWSEAGPGAQRVVPDVAGLSAPAAEDRLAADGLAATSTPVFDEEAPEGTVVGSRPAAAGQVHKNGTVTLLVSAGPELFDVPDVRDGTPEQAAAALAEVGLSLGETTDAFSAQVAEGLVVATEPGPGEAVRAGTAVDVTVSRGPEPVTVPDVTGGDVDAARRLLEAAGLRLGRTDERYDDAVPAGDVLAQDPPGGEARPGTDVDVTVSRGPEPVEVPDVFESRFDDALAELEGLGFVVERRGSNIFGRVVSQDPSAGTMLVPGSTVVVTTF
ncbi:Stk1 family PASTA domain-containing Ser/Thr kinase [Aquipuribacter sp. SD81]|uniref:Stk1 family PASTA domain-containing Ser/Thr kinase n=1 Tax=Aquipuribacter sp. SD81 TaxID=3127703 RepID=UPI00301ABA9C